MNLDFIQDMNSYSVNEAHIEAVARELAKGEHLYDGSNPYGRPKPIPCSSGEFVPSVREIREAMKYFEEKGWYGVYDSDVGYYAVYKEEPSLGEYQRRYTTFIFRPRYANR